MLELGLFRKIHRSGEKRGNDLKSVQSQLKRNHVISELKKFSIFEIDGCDLSTVKYSALLKKLAVVRARRGE